MLKIPVPARADLDKGIKKTYFDMLFATEDNAAHRIDVQLFRGREAVNIADAAVNGYFIRYSDNATIPIDGSASGNIASVTLKKSCYNKPGQFAVIVKATLDGVTNTVFYGEGAIQASSTDTYLDEENIIPSLSDLLAQIDVMEKATANANTATGNANTAADAANTAAERADDAAQQVEGMTVSAKNGETVDAEISEQNGVKHIAFTLQAGVTPEITFTAETGAAGTNVEITQGGTLEKPTVHLTIPRGDTGSVDGIDYYEGTPSALGTASPGDANGVARGNHVHPMPSAEDVGALAADGLLDKTYPVGSIYMSVNSTSPASLFGGTWERLKDRFLLGAGNTYTGGNTGGSATHTLTEAQLPKVTGTILSSFDGGVEGVFNSATGAFSVSSSKKSASVETGSNTRYSTVTMTFGSGSSHNNMPPYLVVNMWKRTA